MLITLNSTASHSGSGPSAKTNLSGEATQIILDGSTQYYAEWSGPLSIKSFYNGQAFYDAGGGSYAVGDDSYLILNAGQPYSITIDSGTRVESFCIFFENGFVEDVYRSLTTNADRLLDEPEARDAATLNFVQRLYPHDPVLSTALFELKASLIRMKDDQAWLAEQLNAVSERLLEVRLEVFKEMERLPALRASTREELYRRLHRARDFASASLDRHVTINDMARVACLSHNHFLRTFKQLFQQSPHQYLTSLRMERAKRLLDETESPVSEICLAVGFQSQSSFSWLFRRRVGLSPEKYRRRKR